MKHVVWISLAWSLLGLQPACGPQGLTGAMEEEELYNSSGLVGRSLFDAEGLAPTALAVRPFIRVGLRWDAEPGTALEGRVLLEDERWSGWQPIEAYWEEGVAHAGHLDVGSGRGLGFQLRLSSGAQPTHVVAEAIEQVGELQEEAAELPAEPAPEEGYVSLEQALAPSSLVHPRSDWGAKAPRCSSSSHTPYRVTVHHTATPSPDSMSPQARLRQIQAYHMYTQGWCDIGYHLLVDKNGAAWQGRNELKVGAHVANQNTGNVGLSYIGTYTSKTPTSAQLNKGAAILRWLHNARDIPLNRTRIKGHRQLASTACPGDKLYAKLNAMVEAAKTSGSGDSGGSSGSTAKGTLSGVVFRDKGQGTADMSTRLPGAKVAIAGVGSKTAAAGDADWTFSLAPKTYTVTASLTGYKSASRSCKVESGETTWCSIGLERLAEQGDEGEAVVTAIRVFGLVRQLDPLAEEPDLALGPPIAGALVSAAGVEPAQTDALGAFELRLAPGVYEIRAEAEGYAQGLTECNVPESGEVDCSLGLVLLAEPDPGAEDVEPEPDGEATDPTGLGDDPGEGEEVSLVGGCGTAGEPGALLAGLALLGLLLGRASRRR